MVSTRQTITTDTAVLSLEEGYIRIKFYNSDSPFDLAEAKRQYDGARGLSKSQPYKVLIDIRDVNVSPKKEAQEFLSSVDEKIAEAILVNSLAARILSRFYMRRTVSNPVRIFSKEQKAVDWLNSL